jgi:hypothetical protein
MSIKFHATIISMLADNHHRVTDEDLGKLIRTKAAGDKVGEALGDSYFRVMVRRTQDKISAQKGEPVQFLDAVGKAMMDVVNATLITDDIAPNESDSSADKARKTAERQRVTGFARSAKSTLKTWMQNGGDIMTLDADTVTKSSLTLANKESKAESSKSDDERARERLAALITSIRKVAESDKARAETIIAEAGVALRALRAELAAA